MSDAAPRLVFMRTMEAVTILVPEGSVGSEMSVQVTLGAAELLDLHNTAVTLLPEPGNGIVALPVMYSRNLRINGTTGLTTDTVEPVKIISPVAGFTKTIFDEDVDYEDNQLYIIPQAEIITAADWGDPTDYQGDVTVGTDGAITLHEGAIVTSALAAAGTGYAVGDYIYVGDAILRVLTLAVTAVATYSVVDAGTIIPVAVGQATTSSGAGTGFTLTVSAIDVEANPIQVDVKMWYKLVDVL